MLMIRFVCFSPTYFIFNYILLFIGEMSLAERVPFANPGISQELIGNSQELIELLYPLLPGVLFTELHDTVSVQLIVLQNFIQRIRKSAGSPAGIDKISSVPAVLQNRLCSRTGSAAAVQH